MSRTFSGKLKKKKKSLPNTKNGRHFDERGIIEIIPVRIQTIGNYY